ncbi:MAG: NADH-quinone oxidoreductase subunit L [Actinomycetota bacterium]|nr:NADH-quinone oxidoreductase subunit L [Actinomycetota bacterium]
MLAALTPIVGLFAFLSEEGGHEVHAGDGGALAEWAWLIVVVPMVITFLIVFFGKHSPWKGWGMATFGMAFVAVYGAILAWKNLTEGILYEGAIEVGRIGDFTIEWGWVVDGLSIMMYFLVGVVGFLVFVYANGYMRGDVRYTWFFASFSLFAGGMLVLVSAPNLIQLIVGWELVGVSSYLLIAHYWEDFDNVDAGNKAFMTNKVADAALFIGVIIMAVSVGSFQFSEIFERIGSIDGFARIGFWAGLALFIGAMGKSAQFPFHVWLPDAMAGPTPVSALMHAATMVTAGIYLVARLFPFYQMPEIQADASVYITIIGAITLFFMGLLALVQDDIKKVLAYSTVSQLGYMMAAMGVGAYTAGLFHLFTHAFFKSLLFLGAGSVIHAVHSNNMSDMGGLRKYMPATFWTFMIGTAALVGLFPFAGFWSKDEIIAAAYHSASSDPTASAWFMVVLSIAGAFVTAFYMARLVSLTFFGKYKGAASPHESPKVMTLPLMGLAFFAAFAGLLNMPGLTQVFTDWVTVRAFPIIEHHATSPSWGLLAIVTPVVLGALAVGFFIFRPKDTQAERDEFRIPVLYPLLEHKYYIDDFYMDGIIRPTMGPIADGTLWIDQNIVDAVPNLTGGAAMHVAEAVNTVDQKAVDGVFNEVSAATGAAGGILRKAFTGRVQQYAAMSFAGVVIIAALFMIF